MMFRRRVRRFRRMRRSGARRRSRRMIRRTAFRRPRRHRFHRRRNTSRGIRGSGLGPGLRVGRPLSFLPQSQLVTFEDRTQITLEFAPSSTVGVSASYTPAFSNITSTEYALKQAQCNLFSQARFKGLRIYGRYLRNCQFYGSTGAANIGFLTCLDIKSPTVLFTWGSYASTTLINANDMWWQQIPTKRITRRKRLLARHMVPKGLSNGLGSSTFSVFPATQPAYNLQQLFSLENVIPNSSWLSCNSPNTSINGGNFFVSTEEVPSGGPGAFSDTAFFHDTDIELTLCWDFYCFGRVPSTGAR